MILIGSKLVSFDVGSNIGEVQNLLFASLATVAVVWLCMWTTSATSKQRPLIDVNGLQGVRHCVGMLTER